MSTQRDLSRAADRRRSSARSPDLTARLRTLTANRLDVDPAERAAFLADKAALTLPDPPPRQQRGHADERRAGGPVTGVAAGHRRPRLAGLPAAPGTQAPRAARGPRCTGAGPCAGGHMGGSSGPPPTPTASAAPGQTRPYNVGMSRAGRPDCWWSTSTRPTLPTRTTGAGRVGATRRSPTGRTSWRCSPNAPAVTLPATHTVATPVRRAAPLLPAPPAGCAGSATPAANAARDSAGWSTPAPTADTSSPPAPRVAGRPYAVSRRPEPAPLPGWLLHASPAAAPAARPRRPPARDGRLRRRGREA